MYVGIIIRQHCLEIGSTYWKTKVNIRRLYADKRHQKTKSLKIL